MKTKRYCILITAMAMVCFISIGCQSVRNFSDFSEFSYRLNLYGIYVDHSFVIEEGMISAAEITRDGDTYLLTMTLFKSGQTGTDDCLFSFSQFGMDCIAEQELEPRELNAQEIENVTEAFSKITVDTVFIPSGTRIESSAPCAIMNWDDFGASNQPPASGPSLITALTEETVETVRDLLLQLRQ